MQYKKNFYVLNTDYKNREKNEFEYSQECFDLFDIVAELKPKKFCDLGFDFGERLDFLSAMIKDEDFKTDLYGVEFNQLAITYCRNFFDFKDVKGFSIMNLENIPDIKKNNFDCIFIGYWIKEYNQEEQDIIINQAREATSDKVIVNRSSVLEVLEKYEKEEESND